MILFYLKKNFADGWDNLLWLVPFNLLMIVLSVGIFSAFFAVGNVAPPLAIVLLVVCVVLCMIPLLAISDACAHIADFKSVPIKEVFANFIHVWKDAVLFGLLISVLIFMTIIGLPFYFDMYLINDNMLGLVLGGFLFWGILIAILSLQWFMSLRSHFGGGFRKNIKKSFIMFFDNSGFSIFVALYSLFLFVLTPLFALMAPGVAGVILAQNNALRLRVYKYDWMEEHPELPLKVARKQIPWDELIGEDRETLGPRDFKSFLFPWK